ncbi:MAG: transketolase [Deltaproteobacteria bacterium]|nr:transketolase [Deltaproteobacteria bacterium]
MVATSTSQEGRGALPFSADSIIEDYRLGFRSRQASLMGRREVLGGKAKFGIFGDGKEVAQLAMARAFRKGDTRAGYYRDQTFMFAAGIGTMERFFHQLYATTDVELEPASAGRMMNGHFATRYVDELGRWKGARDMVGTSGDISPTGSQVPRLVGLAQASKIYRALPDLADTPFSRGGDEVAWGTIGNASCAEGMFWEGMNAAGVLGIPLVMSIWDNGYGISVPSEQQVIRGNVSDLLEGFRRSPSDPRGFDIHVVKGHDYAALRHVYQAAAHTARTEHVPQIIHVVEMTQPQGHSTSGSHERYKSKERLGWEDEWDCLRRLRLWVLAEGVATAAQLEQWEQEDTQLVRELQRKCWAEHRAPLEGEKAELLALLDDVAAQSPAGGARVREHAAALRAETAPFRRDFFRVIADTLLAVRAEPSDARARLVAWRDAMQAAQRARYSDNLVSEAATSPLRVPEIPARYDEGAPRLNGFEIINRCFDALLARDPRVLIFGEDVGKLGDVNQGCAGLQDKHGVLRVADTGIRECTMLGQGIGLAMRGLRPIVEIQYLDYILYALQLMSDDLATLRWRTRGGQMSPCIVRTRGHRLEGVWHSGSPMAAIIHLCRGMHVCVPRNFVQAAGMYNTLLRGDDPAVVVEVLNGYRLKERLPANLTEFTVPLGVPEVIRAGSDVTLVTYGACCRVALEAAEMLQEAGVSAEVIDVQTLLPFDVRGVITKSLQRTNRVVFVDEDVPGGATAYMLQEVLEKQGGYQWLDAAPRTVAAAEHRPAYGSDGDYWSKPNRETIFDAAWATMHETDPAAYPLFFRG